MRILFLFIVLSFTHLTYGQSQVIVLTPEMFNDLEETQLSTLDSWIFKQGNDASWANPKANVMDWENFNPTQLNPKMEDNSGKIEGWFRIRIQLDNSFKGIPLYISRNLWAATDVYIDGILIHSFGNTGAAGNSYKEYNPNGKLPIPVQLVPGKEHVLAMHVVNYEHALTLRELRLKPTNLTSFLNLTGPDYFEFKNDKIRSTYAYSSAAITVASLLMIFFWILVIRNPHEKIFRLIAILSSLIFIYGITHFFYYLFDANYSTKIFVGLIWSMIGPFIAILDLMLMELIIKKKIPYLATGILFFFPVTSAIAHIYDESLLFSIVNAIMLLYFAYLVLSSWKKLSSELGAVIIGMVVNMVGLMTWVGLHKYYHNIFIIYDDLIMVTSMLAIPISLLVYVSIRLNNILREVKEKANNLLQMSEEKKTILANQNIILEQQVTERTQELNQSLLDLKATQSQLIHSEKMASLGELTAGIAHEIQNPLNFVNNFSDVNKELVDELREEIKNGNMQEAEAILKDIEENEEKILHHGKRADGIVKGMLQHSRAGGGEKEPTDINTLCDEYLRLAYHGLRAKDKSFNADFKTELDPDLPKVNVVPQDIGRVLLNLINNAFYAVSRKSEAGSPDYKPEVVVSTKRTDSPLGAEGSGGSVEISVKDNGSGIPEDIKDKIFQPFFTTKSTGEGTGLGLSLSYDIVTAHGGELRLVSNVNTGTEFLIKLIS